MDDLFNIFIANIIDREDVETRKTVVSRNLDLAEKEILDSITDEEIKEKFHSFKKYLTEHYLCIREEDCSKVLAVAMTFNRLIDEEMRKMRDKEIENNRKFIDEMFEKVIKQNDVQD